jgi:hypothetical protein
MASFHSSSRAPEEGMYQEGGRHKQQAPRHKI